MHAGLGMMGKNMASNLYKSLGSNDTLHVYDAVPASMEAFVSSHANAKASKSSTDLIQSSETVILSLPNTSHVQSIFSPFLDSLDNATPSQLKDKLFVDTSTISPAATKTISDSLVKNGAILIDAPVSGGVVGATNGTLTFMISQPSSLPHETIQELLSTMGKRIIVCGDYPGAGLAAKLANNYALAMNNLATCDAMLLGEKLGLDPKILAQVLNTSTGKSWPSEANNPVPGVVPTAPAGRDYEGGFGIGLMRKDLELALEAEKQASVIAGENRTRGKLSLLSTTALDLYKEVESKKEFAKKDFSVVYQHLKQMDE
jgi:3-hydroxyisobutyrate dehydrogenase